MCGFAGKVNTNHIELNSNIELRMKAALKSLHPRGPDHQGIYTDEYSYLVHARLSIIDTSDNGSQPMNKYNKTIVYNGEIYNYKELKNEIKSNYKFKTNCDTEIILAGFSLFGNEFIKRLNGIYSIALWDNFKKKLILSIINPRN